MKLLDKSFEVFISRNQIQDKVSDLADKINSDFFGKDVLFISVLNGSFMFAADLMKNVSIDSEITFVKMSSYDGTSSLGNVDQLIGLNHKLKGKSIIIIEDIIDTGYTLFQVIKLLNGRKPNSLEVCCLLNKSSRRETDIDIRWSGFDIPDEFVVGYGIDYAQNNRNLPYIGKVIKAN